MTYDELFKRRAEVQKARLQFENFCDSLKNGSLGTDYTSFGFCDSVRKEKRRLSVEFSDLERMLDDVSAELYKKLVEYDFIIETIEENIR